MQFKSDVAVDIPPTALIDSIASALEGLSELPRTLPELLDTLMLTPQLDGTTAKQRLLFQEALAELAKQGRLSPDALALSMAGIGRHSAAHFARLALEAASQGSQPPAAEAPPATTDDPDEDWWLE